jgi:hypothetical protein
MDYEFGIAALLREVRYKFYNEDEAIKSAIPQI